MAFPVASKKPDAKKKKLAPVKLKGAKAMMFKKKMC